MDEDLDLWKENSETLFNNVLVKFKHAKKHHLMKLRIQLKQDGEGSRLLRLQHGVSFCWKNSARLLSKKVTRDNRRRDVTKTGRLPQRKMEQERMFTLEKNGSITDTYLGKKMKHKRMLTSKKKWSIRGC
ncbi:hypothetical protein AtEden1_Chr1g0045301 [Arabidopsis thaliana]